MEFLFKKNTDLKYLSTLKELVEYRFVIDNINNRTRKIGYVYARHMFCYIARKRGYSYNMIGAYLDKNHATIMHAVKEAEAIIKYDSDYLEKYQMIIDDISSYKQDVDFKEIMDLDSILNKHLLKYGIEDFESLKSDLTCWSENIVKNLKK